MTSGELPLSDIVNTYLTDMDVILAEGYKSLAVPKIEVLRSEISAELVCKNDPNLIAVVGDKKSEIDIPFFHVDDNASLIVDFLLSRLKKSPADSRA